MTTAPPALAEPKAMKTEEIEAEIAEIKGRADEFAERTEHTDDQLEQSEADIARYDLLAAEHTARVERAEKVEKIRSASLVPTNRLGGSAVDDGGSKPKTRNIYDIEHLRSNVLMSPEAVASELVSRAYDAIEDLPERYSDAVRSAATATLENVYGSQAEAAAHILTVGNPAYRSAFRKIMRGENLGLLEQDEMRASRAAMSLTSANGGYLLPFELDPSIILTNAGTVNAIRGKARVVQTTQNVWHGVSSAGVTAEWTAEAAEAADASPTFVQPTVTAYKADAYLQATFEFLQDSNIESDIGMLVADAKTRLEATAFTVGNGTTQPAGIITRLAAVTASRVSTTTNAAFGAVDVLALDTSLSPRWRENASFIANKGIYNLARLFATGSGALSGSFWVDFGGGLPPKMIGYEADQVSDMTGSLSAATASTDNILVLGDFKQYLIADRIGVSMVYEPLVKGASFRPTGQVGWYTTWRVGGDVLVNDAFRLLQA